MDIKNVLDTLRVKLICCGFSDRADNLVCKNAEFGFNKLFYLKSGEIVIETEDKKTKISGGTLCVINAGKKHSIKSSKSERIEAYWIYFDANVCTLPIFDVMHCKTVIDTVDEEGITRLFEELLYNTNNYTAESAIILNERRIITQILLYCINSNDSEYDFSLIPLEKAVNYMEENLDKKISVADIASLLGIKSNHCINLFNDFFGVSPIKFLNDMRINMARKLLETTNTAIGTVGRMTGCGDNQTFSKVFKTSVGFSPKKYREMFGKTIKTTE